MKKLFALLIAFQLLSCGGINVSDIPLENVAEHRILIRDNIEDREALEKAYVELSGENSQVYESPYIFYYLSLIYSGEYESLFDLDPLESGLVLSPNDPFLNNMKVNMDDNLDSSLEGYKNILENHPRFYAAVVNIDINYRNYWNSIEDDKDIISEKERVQNLLGVVNLYESGDNNTSEYYNFNEIFSDTIAFNFTQFETIKSNFEGITKEIEAAEEREIERIREEREREIERIREEEEAYLDLYEALDKMRSRSANVNQRIVEYFQTTVSDMTLYLFFTIPNDRPNYGCVTTLTPYGRGEPISVDCKSLYTKVAQWNAIPGSPKIY